jgi:anti-sigma factor RsiW
MSSDRVTGDAEGVPEQLSAYLDGELNRGELARLAARWEQWAPTQAGRLARYAVIGELLRGAAPPGGSAGHGLAIAQRVRAALPPSSRQAAEPRRWQRPAALAASTVGLFLAAMFARHGIPPDFLLPDAVPRVAAAPASASRATPVSAAANLSSGRLTDYLLIHGEYSGVLATRALDSHIVASGALVNAPESGLAETATRPVGAGR